ncbi:MAG: hypothetical protein JXN61_14330 [Sedimentisphaerales bacterium]|nr:hypothetical protein [Sedimentisphaerales bacterium]
MSSTFGVPGEQFGARTLHYVSLALACLFCICGCSLTYPQAWIQPKDHLYDKELSAAYDQTRIKKSLTLDVLPRIGQSKNELLSQSESVVASLGQSKEGYKTWFTMVAFHEYELSVIRKYFFVVDEKVEKRFTFGRGFRFDCEMLLDEEELKKLGDTKELGEVALLKRIGENLSRDSRELDGGTEVSRSTEGRLDVNVLLIKQVLDAIIRGLERSPVLAPRITDPNGIGFDHINFGEGKVRMWAEGNVVAVKIKLGAFLPTFHELAAPAVAPQRQVQPELSGARR